jgi:tetratricopeptide (TPR) repeat protein
MAMIYKKNSNFRGAGKRIPLILLFLISFEMAGANGLTGEYLLSDQWKSFSQCKSPLSNPAFMNDQNYINLRLIGSLSSDAVGNLWEFGAVIPFGLYQSFGFTITGENDKQIQSWLYDESRITVKESNSQNNNLMVVFSHAVNPFDKVTFGVNVSYVYMGNFGQPKNGISADAGVSYRFQLHPVLGEHLMGVTYKNVLSIISDDQSFMKLPASMNLIYRIALFQDRFNMSAQYVLSDLYSRKEYYLNQKPVIEKKCKIQGGLKFLPGFILWGSTQINDKIDYWSVGLEVDLPQANSGRELMLLYQIGKTVKTALRGSHSLYFFADIGQHREEFYARKITRKVSFSANDLYDKAMNLYTRELYWDACVALQKLQYEFPDFFKNDQVAFYTAICLEKMDMRNASMAMYNHVKETYPLSATARLAVVGMMRVAYREKMYNKLNELFLELNKSNKDDPAFQEGCYLIGEMFVNKKDYSTAIQYFNKIKEDNAHYGYAQHSLAIIYMLLNKDSRLAQNALENSLTCNIADDGALEIVNRSYLMLGYLFYEEMALSKAITAFRMIPRTSYYYDDALLGICWTALRAHQWIDARNAGQQLLNSKSVIMQCEGGLIVGYSQMMENNFATAVELLKTALKKSSKITEPPIDSLNSLKWRYENTRIIYDSLSHKLLSRPVISSLVSQEESRSLQVKQKELKKSIDIYLRLELSNTHQMFLHRNLNQLREDLEYTLVKTEKLKNSQNGAQNRLKVKEKEIELQIENLKKQIK